jgi:HlyD family secretion protein
MNQPKLRFIIGAVIVVFVTAGWLFLRNNDFSSAKEDGVRYKELPVQRGTFQIAVSASGVVQPIDRIEIKSKASGRIEELPVEEGDFVKKGDLIARLDQKDERAEVEQTQADLDVAKAELKQAQHIFDRRDQLFQKGLISEEERDQIELSLAVARGKLIQATTALERARERFIEATVQAPIDGIILQKYVEEGQIIASGVSNVSGGTPIVDIADMSSVYIEAGIDEIDIGKVKIGQLATVVAEAYPQHEFYGKIVRVAPEAKIEQNVTLFDVIIEVENTDRKLKSGMNANVEIIIVKKEDVLLAPAIALQMPKGPKARPNVRVALLKTGNEFVRKRVKIGLSNFKHAEVISGLEEGDILGVPIISRLKAANERLEKMIKSSRSFGTTNRSSSSKKK